MKIESLALGVESVASVRFIPSVESPPATNDTS